MELGKLTSFYMNGWLGNSNEVGIFLDTKTLLHSQCTESSTLVLVSLAQEASAFFLGKLSVEDKYLKAFRDGTNFLKRRQADKLESFIGCNSVYISR